MKYTIPLVWGLLACALLPAAKPADLPAAFASPYLRPEMARLMEAVTLRVSFDHGTVLPDMAEGEQHAPQVFAAEDGGPRFAPGRLGQALVLGSGGAIYPRAGNVRLESRGAMAFWVRPEGWQRPNDGNILFAMTTNAAFYLQRQGPLQDDEGRVTRHEVLQYLVRDGSRLEGNTDYSRWENGDWHLVVANWSWPGFELSIDGGPFLGKGLTVPPDEKTFGDLILGDRSGGARGLLDELLVFRRPLTAAEVQLLLQLQP